MFARRERLIYEKLLPGREINVWKNTKQMSNRYFKPGDKIYLIIIILVKNVSQEYGIFLV